MGCFFVFEGRNSAFGAESSKATPGFPTTRSHAEILSTARGASGLSLSEQLEEARVIQQKPYRAPPIGIYSIL
jgi:hypothetical protein